MDIRALHFVPMGVHLVYMGAQCRSNGRPWAQNVGLWWGLVYNQPTHESVILQVSMNLTKRKFVFCHYIYIYI